MAEGLLAAPAPRLKRSPILRTFRIGELLADLLGGQVRVPRSERGRRWSDDDRLAFFDSLHRGYPVGSLALWRHEAEADALRFGRALIPAGAQPDALWVVDGRERVTTLAETRLRGPAEAGPELEFDLDTSQVRFAPEANGAGTAGASATSVPLRILLDEAELPAWLVARGVEPAKRNAGLDASARLLGYELPAYILESDDENAALASFARLNVRGRARGASELAMTLLNAFTPGERLTTADVASSLGSLGFGQVDERWVYDVLAQELPLGPGSAKGYEALAGLDRGSVSNALRSTERAMREAIHFLAHDAGLPHLALCPDPALLSTISRFFHQFGPGHPRNRILLRRWFWRAATLRALGGAAYQMPRPLHVRSEDESAAVQRLLAVVARFEPQISSIASVNPPKVLSRPGHRISRLASLRRTAEGRRLFYCALAGLGPRDLRTGEAVDLRALFESAREDLEGVDPSPDVGPDSIDATQLPATLPAPSPAAVHSPLEGRLIHPPLGPPTLTEALKATTSERVLASHAVSPEAQSALRGGDLREFLRRRSGDLRNQVERFLSRRQEWGADDSPPLDSMLVDEGDE
jgi:Protein of unknown function DUF262